jgi:hypothetical protein
MKVVVKFFRILFIVIILVFPLGCTPTETEGIISVVDLETGLPVPNAKVEIFVDTQSDKQGFYLCNEYELTKKMEYFTNSGGSTKRICFKLPAILKVNVSAMDLLFFGKTGSTTLSLVEGETTSVVCKISN